MDHTEKSQDKKPPPSEAPLAKQQAGIAPQPCQIPPTFNLYHLSEPGCAGTYVIGQSQHQTLFMCACHSKLSSSPSIVLHGGPDESFPPLATVEWSLISSSFYVELPPVNPTVGTASTREKIQSIRGFGPRGYQFSIETGPDNVREQFEWRHSSGDVIRHLGGPASGWKLVRLTDSRPFAPGVYTTSDGHEVVAAWVMNPGRKIGSFHFTGSGLSGQLGERWEIATVMTFCAMLERIRRQSPNATVAATAPPV